MAALAALAWTQTDLDGDGLTATAEMGLRTDSFRKDTDLDTVDDGWEANHELNPLSRDTDDDGLTDRAELDNGTNPRSVDSDNDGIPDPEELALGTDPLDSDSDDDTLGDALEREIGTHPLRADTDADGLPDAEEVLTGGNPHRVDTDLDGIGDAAEPRSDCNSNGLLAIADADDDSDERTDGREAADELCARDFDQDGVPDGQEGNVACIRASDCDGDGLADGVERQHVYDALNSDTHSTGLNDAIALAFQLSNQPPSRDGDGDGIPDAWEGTRGLVDWGGMPPQAGQRDLLVEYVRVVGPHSGRYRHLDFRPAYEAVAQVFRDAGVRMQWVETLVERPNEERPHLIPSSYGAYYEDVLTRGRYSANPYVTTVVMNPQHDQSELLHAGAAPIRGMLAAVDAGAHVVLNYQFTYVSDYYWDWDDWTYVPIYETETVPLAPVLESMVVGNRQDLIRGMGFLSGGTTQAGELFLRASAFTLRWTPHWFLGNPYILLNDGTRIPMYPAGAEVETPKLSHTILHELGHTLGLCHAHDEDCYRHFSPQDQFRTHLSTMSYESTGLMFLPSEWTTVQTYLTCPPQESLASIANRAPLARIIEDKYGYLLDDVLSVDQRRCGQPRVLAQDLAPDGEPLRPAAANRGVRISELTWASFVYVLPWDSPQPAANDVLPSFAFVAGGFVAAGAAAYATVRMDGRHPNLSQVFRKAVGFSRHRSSAPDSDRGEDLPDGIGETWMAEAFAKMDEETGRESSTSFAAIARRLA